MENGVRQLAYQREVNIQGVKKLAVPYISSSHVTKNVWNSSVFFRDSTSPLDRRHRFLFKDLSETPFVERLLVHTPGEHYDS